MDKCSNYYVALLLFGDTSVLGGGVEVYFFPIHEKIFIGFVIISGVQIFL